MTTGEKHSAATTSATYGPAVSSVRRPLGCVRNAAPTAAAGRTAVYFETIAKPTAAPSAGHSHDTRSPRSSRAAIRTASTSNSAAKNAAGVSGVIIVASPASSGRKEADQNRNVSAAADANAATKPARAVGGAAELAHWSDGFVAGNGDGEVTGQALSARAGACGPTIARPRSIPIPPRPSLAL